VRARRVATLEAWALARLKNRIILDEAAAAVERAETAREGEGAEGDLTWEVEPGGTVAYYMDDDDEDEGES